MTKAYSEAEIRILKSSANLYCAYQALQEAGFDRTLAGVETKWYKVRKIVPPPVSKMSLGQNVLFRLGS